MFAKIKQNLLAVHKNALGKCDREYKKNFVRFRFLFSNVILFDRPGTQEGIEMAK